MQETANEPAGEIEVIPPSSAQIQAFARSVCQRLAEYHGDQRYVSAEVIYGFTAFLEVIVGIQAKHYPEWVDKPHD
jgi:hypothetical protein